MSGSSPDPSGPAAQAATLPAGSLSTVDGSRGPAPTPTPSQALQAGAPLRVGAVLGEHYRLERRLGAGGMGEAWEATHTVLDKRVALKVLLREHDEAIQRDGAERMLREARIVAAIEHPNIVQIVDFGHTAAGDPFFVMDLVRGQSLRDVCTAEGALPWPRVRNLLRQIAEALDAAHQNGVVHRDVKPDNVLLTMRDGVEVAKVIDFGVAKSIRLQGEARRLTRTGAICGTPAFMSPEQVRGDALDGRTDIYALGCLAYELLAGHRPFGGTTPHELIYAHLFTPVPDLPSHVPPPIVAVVMRCLQKRPEDRYASMTELQAALAAIDSSPSVTLAAEHMPVAVDHALPGRGRSPTPPPGGTRVAAEATGRTEVAEPLPPASADRRLPLVAAAVVGVLVLGVAGWWATRDPASAPAATNERPDAAAPDTAPIEVAAPPVAPAAAPLAPPKVEPPPPDAEPSQAPPPDARTEPEPEPEPSAKPRRPSPRPASRSPRPTAEPAPRPEPPPSPKTDDADDTNTPKRRADGTFELFPE